MLKYFILVVTIFTQLTIFGQSETDRQLAEHYYSNNEFDKALPYYDALFKKEHTKYYFNRLFECLVATKDMKEAEKLLKKQVNLNKADLEYPVLLGQFYEDQGEISKADDIYEELISDLRPVPTDVVNLFNAFKAKGKNEFAFKTIKKGRDILKSTYPLHFQFAEYYGAVGQTDKMIAEYLDLIDFNANYRTSVEQLMTRQIDFSNSESKEFLTLKQELLTRVQKSPENQTYAELLIWLFIQNKDFNAALVQTQSMDKRLNQNGQEMFKLGQICIQNNEYTVARKAFKYVKDLGTSNMLYYKAENALLNTRFLEITTNRNFEQEEIQVTISEYKSTLQRIGRTHLSLPLIMELAHIEAFYGNDAESAIASMTDALTIDRLNDIQKAEVKMQLADIHVLHGDIWEASLLYMQIDKSFKFEPIGHEARFKNARVFYYDGEFDYAQSQLDVLKQGTSRLISNDAIQLSLLITDNYGLDSNYTAMFWFATADLFIEQHKYAEAYQLFDSIMVGFPYHSLGDEILMKKSRAMQLQGKWTEALAFMDELLKYYSDDILADDAWFIKGNIYQNHLFDNEKAKACYLEILMNYKGSLHETEARKRFRKLNGEITEEDSFERG